MALRLGSSLLGVVTAVLPGGWYPAVSAAGRSVSFRAADGHTINALLMESDQRPAPAVILVPMLGRPKDDWQATAQRLADASIMALAIDLRSQVLPGDARTLTGWHGDILAAVGYMAARPDVRASSIGVAGASLGASLATVAAAADQRIRSLALISPSLDYRGVRIDAPLRQYGTRPALLLASLRDPFAARSVRALAEDPRGIREMQWSETPAHGTVLLARDPAASQLMVDWFRRTLG